MIVFMVFRLRKHYGRGSNPWREVSVIADAQMLREMQAFMRSTPRILCYLASELFRQAISSRDTISQLPGYVNVETQGDGE